MTRIIEKDLFSALYALHKIETNNQVCNVVWTTFFYDLFFTEEKLINTLSKITGFHFILEKIMLSIFHILKPVGGVILFFKEKTVVMPKYTECP